jgi:prepilin-type processing-associated H-X9-DG protein
MAIRLFSQEHRGYMPTCSDSEISRYRYPQISIWVWRKSASDPQPVMLDWASSLLPYLGVKNVEWFPYAPERVAKVFLCPSDKWQDVAGKYGTTDGTGPQGPGLVIYNNVDPYLGGYPISFGINADIASVVYSDGVGHFGPPGVDTINAFGGPTVGVTVPLNAKFDKVKKAAEVLLVADCGTRPNTGSPNIGYMRNDAVYYTSNDHGKPVPLAALKEDAGKLSGVSKFALQAKRIPWDRHKNKINVAFVDGHGETIQKGTDESKVRISPYNW